MEKLYQRWETKAPYFHKQFTPLVQKLVRNANIAKSDGSDEDQFDKGKAYGTVYEFYLKSVIEGFKTGSRIPLTPDNRASEFAKIHAWTQHQEIKKYVFMCLLAVVEWPFEELENLSDDAVDAKALELVRLMEEYANGGMELLSL